FPRRSFDDAAGKRRGTRARPAGDAGDRRHPHRPGAMDPGGRRRDGDGTMNDMTPPSGRRQALAADDPAVEAPGATKSTARTLRTPAALAAAGLVPREEIAALEAVAARYAVAITPAMAELIGDAGDSGDPIGRQF